MSSYQDPWVPTFARELDPAIVQLHSFAYRSPSQLREGGVLIVGAGNSGSEIARELAREGRGVWLAGRDTGHIPFRIEGLLAKLLMVRLVLRVVFHRILTVDTPIGRKARPKMIGAGGPLIRVKPKDLAAIGVRRTPRVAGVRDGRPVLDDGTLPAPGRGVRRGPSPHHVPQLGRDRGRAIEVGDRLRIAAERGTSHATRVVRLGLLRHRHDQVLGVGQGTDRIAGGETGERSAA